MTLFKYASIIQKFDILAEIVKTCCLYPSYSNRWRMDWNNSGRAFGFGIAASLLFSLVNGISTHFLKGETVQEWAVSKVGGK